MKVNGCKSFKQMGKYWIGIVLFNLLFSVVVFPRQQVSVRNLPEKFKIILYNTGTIHYGDKILTVAIHKGRIVVGTTKLAKTGVVDTVLTIEAGDTVLNVIQIIKPAFEIRLDPFNQHPQNVGALFDAPPEKIFVVEANLNQDEMSLAKLKLVSAVFNYFKHDDTLSRKFKVRNAADFNRMLNNIRIGFRPGDVIYSDHIEILLNGKEYKEEGGDYFGYRYI
jgi:hypothetical protein